MSSWSAQNVEPLFPFHICNYFYKCVANQTLTDAGKALIHKLAQKKAQTPEIQPVL